MDIAPDGHLICNLCGEPGGECVCGRRKERLIAIGKAMGSRFTPEERAALEACAGAAMHCALCDNSDWVGDPERIERYATTLRKMLEGDKR